MEENKNVKIDKDFEDVYKKRNIKDYIIVFILYLVLIAMIVLLVFRIIDKNKTKNYKITSNEISLGIVENEER